MFKNCNRRHLVLRHEEGFFVKEHFDSKNQYPDEDINKTPEFVGDNIFVVFAGKVPQHTVGISVGTDYVPLLEDIFLYTYEADFISLCSHGNKTVSISVPSR